MIGLKPEAAIYDLLYNSQVENNSSFTSTVASSQTSTKVKKTCSF